MKAAKVEHAELGGLAGAEADVDAARSLRLPQSEIATLQFLWRELPERAGLASNMASTIARLEQLSTGDARVVEHKEPRAAKVKRSAKDVLIEHLGDAETEAERVARRAEEAMAHLPAHVRIDLPPEELSELRPTRARTIGSRGGYAWWNPRDGLHGDERQGDVRAAKNCRPPTMACKVDGGGGSLRQVAIDEETMLGRVSGTVSALLAVEQWAERTNREHAAKVRAAWLALQRMGDEGNGDLVATLYAMYGGAHPAALDGGLFRAQLGERYADLAPLVLHTRTVLEHAETMTRRLRTALASVSWVARGPHEAARAERHETVTPREAALDLLIERHGDGAERAAARRDARTAVRRDAERRLIWASSEYMVARGGRRS